MAEEFDVYCALSGLQLREGAVVSLDGIDGFFDQYFEAVRPGEIIRFAILPGGPSAVPDSRQGLEALPFVTASVERCDPIGGDVEVRSVSTLGGWSHSLQLTIQPLAKLQQEFSDAPLAELVAGASRDGSAYWRSGVKYWRSLDETSAIAAFQDDAGVRLVIIRTNAVPGVIARVSA